jgi:hypothetical protein
VRGTERTWRGPRTDYESAKRAQKKITAGAIFAKLEDRPFSISRKYQYLRENM